MLRNTITYSSTKLSVGDKICKGNFCNQMALLSLSLLMELLSQHRRMEVFKTNAKDTWLLPYR